MGGEGRPLRDGLLDLADDEQLVIEGRSPECAYWGVMLWNPFMQTFDYRYERIGIDSAQATYEPDRLEAGRGGRRIPATRTGCRPPVTGAACCSSAGSSPTRRRRRPSRGVDG